jgi:hypothetical protein
MKGDYTGLGAEPDQCQKEDRRSYTVRQGLLRMTEGIERK